MTTFAGSRLQQARQSAGVSREELAYRTGRSFQLIYKIELGHANPSIETLTRISDFLGVPVGEFFKDSEPE
jgi:transcriptional regulator with XRE-family HTH domain